MDEDKKTGADFVDDEGSSTSNQNESKETKVVLLLVAVSMSLLQVCARLADCYSMQGRLKVKGQRSEAGGIKRE